MQSNVIPFKVIEDFKGHLITSTARLSFDFGLYDS